MPLIVDLDQIKQLFQQITPTQISVDLGSSRYAIAVKTGQQPTSCIDLDGAVITNEDEMKKECIAFVELHSIINQEKVPPQDVQFGGTTKYPSTNMAMLPNWKNYFFESSAHVEYPKTPTMPSANNRSARIRVSCIYEAFFLQCLLAVAKLTQNKEENYIFTLLLPQIQGNANHISFLIKCFQSVCDTFLQNQKHVNVCFVLVKEAVAASMQYIEKCKKESKPLTTFVLADIGGYTTDIAKVDIQNGTCNIEVKTVNVAGNSINLVVSNMIKLQFPDLQVLDFYQLFKQIDSVKKGNSYIMESSQSNHSFNHFQCCSFVLQIISDSLAKILLDQKNLSAEKLAALLEYVKLYLQYNIQKNIATVIITRINELLQNKPYTHSATQQFLQELIDPQRTKKLLTTTDVQLWAFQSLLPNVQCTCFVNLLQHFQMNFQNTQFLKARLYLTQDILQALETKVLGKTANKQKGVERKAYITQKDIFNDQKSIYEELSNILPLLNTYDEFKKYIDLKEQTLDEEHNPYSQIGDLIKNEVNNAIKKSNNEAFLNAVKSELKKNQFSKEIIEELEYNLHNELGVNMQNIDDAIQNNVFITEKAKQNIFVQGCILLFFVVNPCSFLKQQIGTISFGDDYNNHHRIIDGIEIKDNFLFHVKKETFDLISQSVFNKICEEIGKPTDLVLSGGFSRYQQFSQKYASAIRSLKDADLARGGIFETLMSITQPQQKFVSNFYTHSFHLANAEEIQKDPKAERFYVSFEKQQLAIFKENKVCIDQGTGGTQGYYVWANTQYAKPLGETPLLLGEKNIKRILGNDDPPVKMPSFAIFDIDKFQKLLESFNITDDFDMKQFLLKNYSQISQADLQEVLSFELYDQQDGNKKQLKTRNCSLLFSWKKLLYAVNNPIYPGYPIMSTKATLGGKQMDVQIPLSLFFTSQLLFLKQKYFEHFQNSNAFYNDVAYTLTVPCGANAQHLHFVRCCAKAAGLGDNVSFVFEPISAVSYAIQSSLNEQTVQNQDPALFRGDYLIIDVGSGTTDLAHVSIGIQSYDVEINKIQKKVFDVDIQTHVYTSIMTAGDAVDKQILDKIKLFKLVSEKTLKQAESRAFLQLQTKLNLCKKSKDQFSIVELKFEQETTVQEVINNYTQLKNELDQNKQCTYTMPTKENKLMQFQISTDLIISALKDISNSILQSVNDFIDQVNKQQQIKINKQTIRILCTGGIGGCPTFQCATMKEIFGQDVKEENLPNCKQLLAFKGDQASISIAAGGVFMSSEKDHLNFDVQKMMASRADENKVFDDNFKADMLISWKLLETHTFTNIANKQLTEQQLEQLGLQAVLVKNKSYLSQNRMFRCTANWDGVTILIEVKTGLANAEQNTKQFYINFNVDELKQFALCPGFQEFSCKLTLVQEDGKLQVQAYLVPCGGKTHLIKKVPIQ